MDNKDEFRFLKACRGQPVDRTPVWFMRQAGRYMKAYRDLKEKYTFLEMCKNPELATEVTLQPLDVLGVDAAIIFADILLPLEPMGTGLEFSAVDGPVIPRPVKELKDIEKLCPVDVEADLGFVMDAIRMVRGTGSLEDTDGQGVHGVDRLFEDAGQSRCPGAADF